MINKNVPSKASKRNSTFEQESEQRADICELARATFTLAYTFCHSRTALVIVALFGGALYRRDRLGPASALNHEIAHESV